MNNTNADINSFSIIELINQANLSVRLKNAMNRADQEQRLPFSTLGDYFSAGTNAEAILLEIPNLGAKTAREFVEFVEKIVKGHGYNILDLTPGDSKEDDPDQDDRFLYSLSLLELVNKAKVSVRLRNAFNKADMAGKLPFKTVGEFNALGDQKRNALLGIESLGQGTADEFIQLLAQLNEFNISPQNLSEIRSVSQEANLARGNEYLALFKAGFSYEDIASQFNVSVPTVKKYLTEHPDFEKRPSLKISEKQRKKLTTSEEFLELYKQGLTYQDIGEKYKITREYVRQILKINPNFHVYRKEREASKAEASREKEERFKQKLEESSILHLYPEKVAEFWDYEKNQGLLPSHSNLGHFGALPCGSL